MGTPSLGRTDTSDRQHYYDVSAADAVLDFVKTPRAQILQNMVDALTDIGEFMDLSQAA